MGFCAYAREGPVAFEVRLSIEKDPQAHATLELRSFFRKFPRGRVPEASTVDPPIPVIDPFAEAAASDAVMNVPNRRLSQG